MLRESRWTPAGARRGWLAAAAFLVVLAAPSASAKPAAATASADGAPQVASSAPVVASTGMPTSARIIGGQKVAPGGWPFLVSLRLADGSHQCGGTVIAADLVITAAHCVHDDAGRQMPASAFFVVAKQLVTTPITGERLPVAKIVTNPGWNRKTFAGDAALVFLGRATTAAPIPLADLAFEASALGGFEWTAGWGSTVPWAKDAAGNFVVNPVYPNDLQEVQIGVAGPQGCNAAFPQSPPFWTNWHLCAGSPPKTTCNGDSGGPHVVRRSDGQWILLGITSIGWITARAGGGGNYCTTYDGITRAAVVADWAIASWKAYHAAPPADRTPPRLTLHSQRARARRSFSIDYRVFDNSHVTSDELRITRGGRLYVHRRTKFAQAMNKVYTFRVGRKLRRGTYRITLRSTDRAGNSTTRRAKLRVR